MKSDTLNRWISLGANLGVLIGIIFLALEIRQNSNHLALQLEFEATQKIFENNRDLQEPTKAQIFTKAITDPESLTFDEGIVAASLFLNLLNEWEDRYFIYKAGLTGEIDWRRHIQENVQWTLGSTFAQEVYKSNRGAFEVEFVDYVDSLLDEIAIDATYSWWTEFQSNMQSD